MRINPPKQKEREGPVPLRNACRACIEPNSHCIQSTDLVFHLSRFFAACQPVSLANPSNRAAQADEVPVALFFQNGKPGVSGKPCNLRRGDIIPGIYSRFLFCHVPGRVDEDAVRVDPFAG